MRTVFLIASVLAIGAIRAQSPTAEEYFNKAAKQYVKEDKITALNTLDDALREYPGDARLLRLAEELLKEDDQQQQQQSGQSGQDKDQQEEQDQQQGDQQQQKEEQQDKGNAQENKERKEQQEQRPKEGRISPEDARRILDALERQEKDVQGRVQEQLRPTQRRNVDKDW